MSVGGFHYGGLVVGPDPTKALVGKKPDGTTSISLNPATGDATFAGTVAATGATTLTGNVALSGTLTVAGQTNLDGVLDHDGSTVGFYGVTPATRPTALTGAAAASFTAADGSTVDGTYGAEEAAVIANHTTRIAELVTLATNLRTRVNELETKLQSLGLLA